MKRTIWTIIARCDAMRYTNWTQYIQTHENGKILFLRLLSFPVASSSFLSLCCVLCFETNAYHSARRIPNERNTQNFNHNIILLTQLSRFSLFSLLSLFCFVVEICASKQRIITTSNANVIIKLYYYCFFPFVRFSIHSTLEHNNKSSAQKSFSVVESKQGSKNFDLNTTLYNIVRWCKNYEKSWPSHRSLFFILHAGDLHNFIDETETTEALWCKIKKKLSKV